MGNEYWMEIIKRLDSEYPDAGTMLKYSTEFELLIAVIMSAQSTDEQVNRVTDKLFKVAGTPEDFAVMDLDELAELIKGVGIHRNKAKNIKKLSQVLLDEYNSQVPDSFDDLLKLPGVGRKSANVVLSVAFNKAGLGVDTHVQRVSNRIGLVRENKAEATEMALKKLIPEELWSKVHHLLIFHGRQICKARKANCKDCIIEDLCMKIIEE